MKESPERLRERLRQEELKRNMGANLGGAANRGNAGGLVDLVNSLGWKGFGILILLLIVVVVLVRLF
ncbi:DUF6366 family protein [Alkalihalobacillus hemicellulosilyticus]|uniref:Phage capsid protein n=1 Tax=Halalkalibacter hemicellulosilyticusJCM 9152 TaxID=1236971 RepID=W4QFR6_9BACI|nr:DUF6366 family protein [Halalkalibacter hemicellulosilyticus]GAE30488.1 hypothetical protein JCM9152_1896 [Halalkalibacter hemicellulosilyticusJCM 9152]